MTKLQLTLFGNLPIYLGSVTKHPLYRVWCGIISRCHSPKCSGFSHYGGRGIYVCDEWRNSSRAFVAWAINAGWKPGLQLDRVNNDGPYSPGNCRFVTRTQNQLNRRDTARLSDGRSAVAVARANGVCLYTFHSRRRLGWSLEDAAMVPVGLFRKTEKTVCLSDGRPAWPVAKANGISGPIYWGRVKRGWSPDDAVSIPAGGKRPRLDAPASSGDDASNPAMARVGDDLPRNLSAACASRAAFAHHKDKSNG